MFDNDFSNDDYASSAESDDDGDQNKFEITRNEWKQISAVIDILKPIYDATLFVEKRDSHAGHIIPLFKKIEHDLIVQPKSKLYLEVRKAIVGGLEKRLKGNFDYSLNLK